ncbi:MAG TPA: VOC family protein [Actinopolymorphaceae bacterium]
MTETTNRLETNGPENDRPEPAGENTVNGFIVTDGAAELIDFLVAVFDATEIDEARSPDIFAGDGSLIHAEVRIGNSKIMLADRKEDWPFTPALTQVYVADAAETLRRAVERGATVLTEVSPFYGGYDIARFLDPWHNVWWLFASAADSATTADTSSEDSEEWSESSWEPPTEPDAVYTTLLDAMRNLADPPVDRR